MMTFILEIDLAERLPLPVLLRTKAAGSALQRRACSETSRVLDCLGHSVGGLL